MIGKIIFACMFLIIIVTSNYAGAEVYRSGEPLNISLAWDQDCNVNLNMAEGERLGGIICKTIDWFGYCMMEVAQWGVEFGYENPDYNYEDILNKIMRLIWIIIILIAAPLLIVFAAIIWILVEWMYKMYRKGNR